MTVSLPVGRLLSIRVAPRHLPTVTRFGTSSALPRVSCKFSTSTTTDKNAHHSQDLIISRSGVRSYATATKSKPAGRPKAHTGRATAKKPTARAGTKKAGTKKTAVKKKAVKKPKAKKAVKPKRTVKKGPSKTALKREAIAKNKELKERALLNSPKKLPQSAWAVVFSESHPKGVTAAENLSATKDASLRFKNLTPEERERYNHTANANKEKNEIAYKKWLSGFSPEQIRQANLARRQLGRIDLQKNPSKKYRSAKFAPIQDERTVKRPISGYTYFAIDRRSSGDFSGMTIAESSRLIGREWKELSASERKRYEDQGKADRNRYIEEHKTVYGREPIMKQQKKKATTTAT